MINDAPISYGGCSPQPRRSQAAPDAQIQTPKTLPMLMSFLESDQTA